jgi:hypothetical protein
MLERPKCQPKRPKRKNPQNEKNDCDEKVCQTIPNTHGVEGFGLCGNNPSNILNHSSCVIRSNKGDGSAIVRIIDAPLDPKNKPIALWASLKSPTKSQRKKLIGRERTREWERKNA